jgi:thiamine pyrophosphate-dependent acetolactate synthase large subunit-like protein
METIRISGLEEGRNALRAAARATVVLPVDSGGAAWAAEIARILRAEFVDAVVAVDCGNSAGAAMAALREGLTSIGFDGPAAVAAKLEAMGAQVIRG